MTSEFDSPVAELVTRWSVRLAIVCYLGRVLLEVGGDRNLRSPTLSTTARWLWTIGCALIALHVCCAFAFFHDWNHQHALHHTATQTEAFTGIRWSGGLYFNYAFTLFWFTDVAAWWVRGATHHDRSRAYFSALHAVFAFMVFNATVVFGPPWWKLVAPIIAIALVIAYFINRRITQSPTPRC